MSPKAIGNRIKAKGLQKLRWYCQMCNKQCRDENGFKCHQMSESHARQMRLFRENSGDYMSRFSEDFKKGYMEVLRRRGRKRIKANTVYQEYIKDRHHIHMNSTQWTTLSQFIAYLSKEGLAECDQTEKGWFIKWKDTDPNRLALRAAAERGERMRMSSKAVADRMIQEQIERARALEAERADGDSTRSQSERTAKPTAPLPNKAIKIGLGRVASAQAPRPRGGPGSVFTSARVGSGPAKRKRKEPPKKSALESLMEESIAEKKARMQRTKAAAGARDEGWLFRGIVVKVVTKRVGGGRYYRKKGIVRRVRDTFEAEVDMSKSGDILRLDQEHLETVIPRTGRAVLVVNGRYRGTSATMVSLDGDGQQGPQTVTVKIASGERKGELVSGLEPEDVCKLATSS